jgi:hypothetical protein
MEKGAFERRITLQYRAGKRPQSAAAYGEGADDIDCHPERSDVGRRRD